MYFTFMQIKQEAPVNSSDLQVEEPSAFAVSSSRIRRSIGDPVAAAASAVPAKDHPGVVSLDNSNCWSNAQRETLEILNH